MVYGHSGAKLWYLTVMLVCCVDPGARTLVWNASLATGATPGPRLY